MTSKNKKFIAFIGGCLFGGGLLFFESILNSIPPFLVQIIGFPAKAGLIISNIILWPICKFDTTNICRGLGLDGGPLEWIEWAGLFGGMIIGYGLIFLLIYILYLKIKNKK